MVCSGLPRSLFAIRCEYVYEYVHACIHIFTFSLIWGFEWCGLFAIRCEYVCGYVYVHIYMYVFFLLFGGWMVCVQWAAAQLVRCQV